MLKLQIPVNSDGDLFEFDLAKDKVTIGRRHDNDIRIKETYVSAYHAELVRKDSGRFYLRDRDSSNGTFLNGKRIRDRVEVSPGDILKFGSLKCYIADLSAKAKTAKKEKMGAMAAAGSATLESIPKNVRNKTTSISTKNQDFSDDFEEEFESSSRQSEIIGGVYTNSLPKNNFERQSFPDRSDRTEKLAGQPRELDSLKKQLNSNRSELRKAREELSRISRVLSKTREKAAKDEEAKQEKISELEKRLKSKETGNDKLEQRLRLATNRAEQLESELEHHRTDMAVEIKTAMQRFTHTKNDNLLLQGTLEALETERKQYREKSVALTRKLDKTREGFSLLLQTSGKRLEESLEERIQIEESHQKSEQRLKCLETELESLRDDFGKMEVSYRQKLKDAERAIKRGNKTEQTLIGELESANEQLKNQQADTVKLKSSLEVLRAEKEAADEDWRERVLELQTTNQGLISCSDELDTLESKIKASKIEIRKLKNERVALNRETEGLRAEKEALAIEKAKIDKERTHHNNTVQQMREESQQASLKLDNILQNLHESEKKVTYLRNLEQELEKSVLRTQRSALSRKGIYSEDDEAITTIWPETEQLICRELIDRLELLEDLLDRYQQNWFFPKVADQLNLLRDSFMALLKNHSVDQFDLEPGTELSVESRKKIQLISVDDLEDSKLKRLSIQHAGNGSKPKVLQTLRPGYIYSKGGQDVIIRKAEVIVA